MTTTPGCTCHLLDPYQLCDQCRDRGLRHIEALRTERDDDPRWRRPLPDPADDHQLRLPIDRATDTQEPTRPAAQDTNPL